jgi:hypothetical protein
MEESIPPFYVARRAGKTKKVIVPGHQCRNFKQSVGARNRMATRPGIPGLLKSLKIPSQTTKVCEIDSLESVTNSSSVLPPTTTFLFLPTKPFSITYFYLECHILNALIRHWFFLYTYLT